MTYFDPKIYCKQNLKERDRKEIDYWAETIENTIDRAEDDYRREDDVLDDIRNKVIQEFCKFLKEELKETLQDQVIGAIESYEEEIEPVEDPETY